MRPGFGAGSLENYPLNGVTGIAESTSFRLGELTQHHHSRERWRGKKAVQGATDWFDDTLTPFRAISGNNVYGADADDEAKVVGSGDTPIIAGALYYDLHRFLIVDVSHDTVYKLRVVYGTGTMADAITALQYSEAMVLFDSANPQLSAGIPVEFQMPLVVSGMKIWIQAWNATDDAWIDFLIGLHEYPS